MKSSQDLEIIKRKLTAAVTFSNNTKSRNFLLKQFTSGTFINFKFLVIRVKKILVHNMRNPVGHCVRICVDKPQYVYCLNIPDDVISGYCNYMLLIII